MSQVIQIEIKNEIPLKANVSEQAIKRPKSLDTWQEDGTVVPGAVGANINPNPAFIRPSSYLAAYTAIGASVPVLIAGTILTMYLTRNTNSILLPPIRVSGNSSGATSAQAIYDFDYNEEIVYNFYLEDTEKTPIYQDSILYIKIPSWLTYTENTTLLNNNKLTDEADEDVLSYYPDDSLMIMDLGKLKNKKELLVSFTAKVQKQSVVSNEAFCTVKFQSTLNNYESEWQPISARSDQPIPAAMDKFAQSLK